MHTLIKFVPLLLISTAAIAQVDYFGRSVQGDTRLSAPRVALRGSHGTLPAGTWGLLPFVARPIPSRPDAVALGDVTGDGRTDVVMTTTSNSNPEYDYHLFLFPQGPDRTLLPSTKYPYSQTNRTSVSTLDLDGENGIDVVVGAGSGLTVFLANAAGALVPSPPLITQDVSAAASLDFNGDGRKDLATVSWGNGGRLNVNAGDGTLQASPWEANVGGYNSMSVGDLNHDGRDDVAVASQQSYPGITLYQNTGSGLTLLQNMVDFCPNQISNSSAGVAIGDMNGDGFADVVSSADFHIKVFLSNQGAGFSPPTCIASYNSPETLRVADINRDGLADVIVLHGGWVKLGVYIQQSNGQLAGEVLFSIPYATHYEAHAMEIGNFLGDQCPDVAIADYGNGLVTLEGSGCERMMIDGFE